MRLLQLRFTHESRQVFSTYSCYLNAQGYEFPKDVKSIRSSDNIIDFKKILPSCGLSYLLWFYFKFGVLNLSAKALYYRLKTYAVDNRLVLVSWCLLGSLGCLLGSLVCDPNCNSYALLYFNINIIEASAHLIIEYKLFSFKWLYKSFMEFCFFWNF